MAVMGTSGRPERGKFVFKNCGSLLVQVLKTGACLYMAIMRAWSLPQGV